VAAVPFSPRRPIHCDNLKIPRDAADMPARVSEAIVLRTYPLKEADLVVSFLTRIRANCVGRPPGAASEGRFRGVLERLSHGKMFYFQRETRELVNLDACELIHSHFGCTEIIRSAWRSISSPRFRPVPAGGGSEREVFPPAAGYARAFADSARNVCGQFTYFSLWVVRLAGLLPALDVCMSCGTWLNDPDQPEGAYFRPGAEDCFAAPAAFPAVRR